MIAPWVVIVQESLLCERCGASKEIGLPSDMEDLSRLINIFVLLHRDCPDPRPPRRRRKRVGSAHG